jgi:hypothetical protein
LGSHDIKGAAVDLAPLKTETGGPPKSKKAARGRKPIDIEVRDLTPTEAAREIGRFIKNYDADLLPDNSPNELLAEPLQPVGDQKIVVDGNEPPKTPQTPPTVALTLVENSLGPATKVFSLNREGALEKRSAAEIYNGSIKRITVDGIEGLAALLEELQPNHALLYGIGDVENAALVTQEALRECTIPNAIARDRQHFRFVENEPGILMLDHDPRPGHRRLDYAELDVVLSEHILGWSEAARLWRPSSSAFIYRASDNAELIGLGGWRSYVVVDDAAAIPSVGAYIYQKLWSAGHGYIEISKTGQLLDRSIVDASVWQPERMDFAAAPVIKRGLIRRAPTATLLPGAPMLRSNRVTASLKMSEWRKTSKELERQRDMSRAKADATGPETFQS